MRHTHRRSVALVAAAALVALVARPLSVAASPYRADLLEYNLNTNQAATDPTQYSTTVRTNSTYTPSPDNWRAIPFYTLLPDKFADGDPTNNDYFGTIYEYDWRETQLRVGGDLKGILAKLDYIQSMGVKALFISGTPFLNMIWQADSYSPLDFSVLDPHYGTIKEYQTLVDQVHARGMYVMVDFTIGTMADMIAFAGHLNSSTPFSLNEYQAVWKRPNYVPWGFETYADFAINNTWNASCQMPVFWDDNGQQISLQANGCYESDFDQYGDTEAFGVHPNYQRQLSKFASVQDRLREWNPSVMAKLQVFACMTITAFDIDAIRIDKSIQVTVDALASWATATRKCATNLGKKNFMITGEVTGGDWFGSLYYGRGRTPSQRPPDSATGANITSADSKYFLRAQGINALDAVAFHYSIYRSLTRFLGMDGNLQVAYDVDVDFVTAWNEMLINNDFVNPNTGIVDPKHLLGVSNFDIFRWPSLENGTILANMASFVTSMLVPGVPLIYYGEEQNFYLYDTSANNYLYGRQAMFPNQAWQRHGCYRLGSEQYYNMALQKSLIGCMDDWNSRDHFDPTADSRRLTAHMLYLRSVYGALQDGWELTTLGNWTYFIQRPGSNGTETEMGLWTASRGFMTGQNTTGAQTTTVFLLYTNENQTKSYNPSCSSPQWISSPYTAGTVVQNLFYPYENYTLQASGQKVGNTTKGCLQGPLIMHPFSFKALVPLANWVAPRPALTKFSPGHDARVNSDNGTTSVDVRLEFNTPMSCTGVTAAVSLNMSSSGHGPTPSISSSSVACGGVTNPDATVLPGDMPSAWFWSATIQNMPDGILTLTVDNAPSATTGVSTNAVDHLLLRKGNSSNVMVFPDADYDASAFGSSNGQYTFTHKAQGADKFRWSWNFGKNWTLWQDWEDETFIDASNFTGSSNWWSGEHIMVQYWSEALSSAAHVVHADRSYGTARRVPQFLARGPFNQWGFDSATLSQFAQAGDGQWQLEIMATWPTYIQINVFGYDDYFYGDVDGDGTLDRLPPNSAAANYVNISAPPKPHLAWMLTIDDRTLTYSLVPRGSSAVGAVMYALLLSIPLVTGSLAAAIFMWSFYGIKHNRWGVKPNKDHSAYFPILGALGNKSKADLKDGTPLGEVAHRHSGEIIGWPENKNKRRKVLIATLEYEIIDWKLKVKIGGLGVMSSLMGKAMTDVDLVWVVPKVKDLEYPPGEPAEPFEVIIFGEPYLIEVETHRLDNITYVILDSPVFRAQTKADPYPARMDDLSSAIFYSTWNQAIAATVRKFPDIDIYHVNDYHGALVPIYLLPRVLPVCLSLHNAEFQGLWPLRTKEEMKEVCSAFNLSKEHCTKYVQFGNTFNLLHAAASFISVHQKSVGVAGVSDKYGKRSWARYPALWTLKHVDSLPNPDPEDIAALDEHAVKQVEVKWPELERQAQEWAGIKQDPSADLFVFVGRWSKQKGVDLIADVMPSLLEKRPSIQLICVGPVIDLYGRFAAEKLNRLMQMYPDRVYSKPEFTALPPYLFSGADFALIPSRDEPFGLVAVEFGRKGALGVGSRLGGLGLMPGWWFPVELDSVAYMLSQLSKTIKLALKSTDEERAMLRARSAVQRFPVVEWRQRMEDFHARSINTSRHHAASNAWRPSFGGLETTTQAIADHADWSPVHQQDPSQPGWERESAVGTPGIDTPGSGQWSQESLTPGGDPFLRMPPKLGANDRSSVVSSASDVEAQDYFSQQQARQTGRPDYGSFLDKANKQIAKDQKNAPDPFLEAPARPFGAHSRVSSVESIASIVDEKQNSPLNKAIVSFTDADGGVAHEFVEKLQALTPENSRKELSIEAFLQKSEEAFFEKVRKDKLDAAASIRSSQRDSVWGTPAPSSYDHSRPVSPSFANSHYTDYDGPLVNEGDHANVVIMSGLQIAMSREIGGWPLYTIIIALGQVLCATSFQITLLSGQSQQDNVQLYVLGAVFLAASAVWYPLFCLKPSIWVLSAPWLFFGLAFFLIGIPSITTSLNFLHKSLSSVATWCYAVASAASFCFFGLNFGEEAGASTETWMLRACIVQGTQQVWVAALFFWGYKLNSSAGSTAPPWWVVPIVWPLAVMSFLFAYLMLYGLPEYYRQTPPKVPNFLKTLFRRRIVVWFLASEILRDYWLSGPYGKNWNFLWNVNIPKWQIAVLVVAFFIGVWAILLFILTYLSKTHTWLLPVFAVGLGAPRWCQMLWGTSSLALYIPWAGSAGPYLGISLWLWLGVLDAIQGVGLGLILLQTLSRLHVCATLAFAQVIGSVCVMIARATAIGPWNVFPDAGTWDFSNGLQGSPMASALFWIALMCQLIIVLGYFWFYRKEQLDHSLGFAGQYVLGQKTCS
ncbi:glycoside hydrolase family 13 and glycosyltransferase family 5 protein [Vararia minispora EC-137]|uniref:Glycoside hydrolase family 13 and glycosyltransferase family 5 protein n=1 Tax=Vararia minispora EC-137 TaxID=1314806 RepID=A0ACB8QTZ8_9AGAM|nr:glycoside hydrolase family 13 and glycosyltransferase family 5 protein [Vararia minispora EC-137]